MRIKQTSLIFMLLVTLSLALFPAAALAQEAESGAIVRAVLFYSPTCPHCHIVQQEVLPPLQEQYGEQLAIFQVDASTPAGQQVYQNYIAAFNVPDSRLGVPALVVEDVVLVGSQEIPDIFPGLITDGLSRGGTDWPSIPGLQNLLENEGLLQESAAPPSGMLLAWLILLGMLAALVATVWLALRVNWQQAPAEIALPFWLVPLLSVIGIGIAGYLAYVEVTHVEAVCGPIGDCNAVQGSAYAQIMGIPVALLGIIFFLVVALLWIALPRITDNRNRRIALGSMLGLTIAGTLFSVYLTVLEIFVIDAVCAWCLTSAVISTALMLLVAFGLVGSSQAERRTARARRRRMAH